MPLTGARPVPVAIEMMRFAAKNNEQPYNRRDLNVSCSLPPETSSTAVFLLADLSLEYRSSQVFTLLSLTRETWPDTL
jgi:hypothetical protein